ncbi:hypothetical protein V8E54_013218 [Elaphomyces granulatus]
MPVDIWTIPVAYNIALQAAAGEGRRSVFCLANDPSLRDWKYTYRVKKLLTRDDVDIAASSDDGWIPLLTACDQLHESLEIVNLLLAKDGINVNLYNKQRETRSRSTIVKRLLDHPNTVDPNVGSGVHNRTASMQACVSADSLDVVQLLLDTEGIDKTPWMALLSERPFVLTSTSLQSFS